MFARQLGSAILGAVLITGCSAPATGPTRSPEVATPPVPTGPATAVPTTPKPTPSFGARLVALGDSTVGRDTCQGCTTFPRQLATALGQALGVEVEFLDLSWSVTNPKPAEVADILRFVRTDKGAIDALSGADAVVITVGWNDLAFNRFDDPCKVAPTYPVIAWDKLTHACIDKVAAEYRRDLDALLGEIETLRGSKPTMLRVTTTFNAQIGDLIDPGWAAPDATERVRYAVEQIAQTQCEIAERHGGRCADTYHALNGPDGLGKPQAFLDPVDQIHPAQSGHDAFAMALINLGFAPLGD